MASPFFGIDLCLLSYKKMEEGHGPVDGTKAISTGNLKPET